ncbi:LAFA_0F13696g1_1 [Lachancea sp. 'fantastica']|nr:LAFA_0F13696g1_1 [Lachancea sp. 'fantastica']
MKVQESVYSIGYPIYGARFLNNNVLLVTGGGGEGNNGIPNKLTALQVNFEKRKIIKRFRELTLDSNDDSPTTLDAANNIILMGCNESSAKVKAGQPNHHLRKYIFENEHLKFVASVDMDRSKNADDYTKLTYMSQDGSVAAIASSKLPTVIRILNPALLTETYEIETGNDVKDLHFSPDGKVLSYITASTLEVISIVTGRFIVRKTDFNENWTLSKIRFIGEDTVIIAAALKKGSGIVLCKVSLKSGTTSVLKTKIVTTKIKGVTSMDVDPKGQLAALAGNDNSVLIVKLKTLTVAKFFKQVHSFAITRVVFSPDGKALVSVSAANTIHAIRVPDNLATSTSFIEKIVKFLANFVLIVLFAAIVQVTYKYKLHEKGYQFALAKWNARNASFKMNDEFVQTTLVGDVVSVQTKTKEAPTHQSSVTTPTSSFVTSETVTFSSISDSIQSSGHIRPSVEKDLSFSTFTSSSSQDLSLASHSFAETKTVETTSSQPALSWSSDVPENSKADETSSTAESGVEDLKTEELETADEPSLVSSRESSAYIEAESASSQIFDDQWPTTSVVKESAAKNSPSSLPNSSSDEETPGLQMTTASAEDSDAFSSPKKNSNSAISTSSDMTASNEKVSKISEASVVSQSSSLPSKKSSQLSSAVGLSGSDSKNIDISHSAIQPEAITTKIVRSPSGADVTTSKIIMELNSSTTTQKTAMSNSGSEVLENFKSSSAKDSSTLLSTPATITQTAASSVHVDAESTAQNVKSEVKPPKAGSLTSKKGQRTEDLEEIEEVYIESAERMPLATSQADSKVTQDPKPISSESISISTRQSSGNLVSDSSTTTTSPTNLALTSSWEHKQASAAHGHISSAVPGDFEQNYTPDVSGSADDESFNEDVTPDAISTYVDEPAPVEEVNPLPEATAEADNEHKEPAVGEQPSDLATDGTDTDAAKLKKEKLPAHDEL